VIGGFYFDAAIGDWSFPRPRVLYPLRAAEGGCAPLIISCYTLPRCATPAIYGLYPLNKLQI